MRGAAAGRGREVAFTATLAVTMIQLVLAIDNGRTVAVGSPARRAWSAPTFDSSDDRDGRVPRLAFVAAGSPSLREWRRPTP